MKLRESQVNDVAILRELLRRKAKKGSFKDFILYIKPDYYFQWFHEKIANDLEVFLKDKTKKRLMVFMPPQHGKSELTSRLFPAYALGINPNLKIAGASYSIDLARSFNREIQRYIDNPYYKDVFPGTTINTKNVITIQSWLRNSEEFEVIDKKGSYKSVGVMGGLSGRPVDLAIIDDPIKDKIEAESETYRNRVWDWYLNVLETRLHNRSKVILIMTRWHEEDLAGRLLAKEADQWQVISIPAIKREDNEDDPRELNAALWPEKHELSKLLRLEDLEASVFESLYQQNPVSKSGNKIDRKLLTIIDQLPNVYLKSDFYIDGAYTNQSQNDPTGVLEVKYDDRNHTLYICDFVNKRMELPELLEFLKGYLQTKAVPNSKIRIEPKASGKSIMQMLNQSTSFAVTEINNYLVSSGKEARFQNAAPYFQSTKIKLLKGHWNNDFIDQIVKFPKTKHDEAVDLIGYASHDYFTSRISNQQMIGFDNLH